MWPVCPWQKNSLRNKKEQKKKKHIPENASMQVKYRIYTRQSAAFMHSSWTLLQVANVGTHQLIQQMSRNTPRASRKENRYDIQYSIHLTKKKLLCPRAVA